MDASSPIERLIADLRRPGWIRADLDLLSLGLADPESRRESLVLLHRINHASVAHQPWRACIDDESTLILTASFLAEAVLSAGVPAFIDEALLQGRRLVALWTSGPTALTLPGAGSLASADRPVCASSESMLRVGA